MERPETKTYPNLPLSFELPYFWRKKFRGNFIPGCVLVCLSSCVLFGKGVAALVVAVRRWLLGQ